MPSASRLWTCPTCGAKFVTCNCPHSCGRATLDDWKSRMGPRARVFYAGFEQMIAACGEYHVAPAKTRIAFLGHVRFASITRSFALPKPLKSSRFHKIDEVVPHWWVHWMRIAHPRELDDQMQAWIRESYRLMGMRERLRRS